MEKNNSEREWTIEEREEFFTSQDAITGLTPGQAKDWSAGIHITSIVPPEYGWPIAMHCPICKETTFLLSSWAVKPAKGDYFRMEGVCAGDRFSTKHNMQMAMEAHPLELDFSE